jgi:hypothetical protein
VGVLLLLFSALVIVPRSFAQSIGAHQGITPSATGASGNPVSSIAVPMDFSTSESGAGAVTISHAGQTCSASGCLVTSGSVKANAASNNVVVNLPASNATFNPIEVCKTDSTSNTVTLTPNGTDTVNGAVSFVLGKQYQCAKVVDSAVGNWSIRSVGYPVAQSLASHNYATSLSAAGVLSGAQPSSSDLSDLPISVAHGGTQCGAPNTYANLPASPINGEICDVIDATACILGTAVSAGGGSTKCQVTYNGSNWMPGGGAASAASGGFSTAGTGLTGSGSTVSLTTPVTVANGGTQCGAPVAYASLPSSPTNGEICNVTDATGCVAGTAVSTGGGSTKCQVTYNGSGWYPAGGATSSASGGLTAAGTGLTASGGTVSLVTPVTVANGGTQCGPPTTYSSLPGSPTNGEICNITDANACTVGTAVSSGGGSTKCQITYNGSSWYPAGGSTAPTLSQHNQPVRFGFQFAGGVSAGNTVPNYPCLDSTVLPMNFAGSWPDSNSFASCTVNPGETDVYAIGVTGTGTIGSMSLTNSCVASFNTAPAPTIIGSTKNSAGTSINVPTNANGDLLLWFITTGSMSTAACPSGWHTVSSVTATYDTSQGGLVCSRIASSEPSSYSFTTGFDPAMVMVDTRGGGSSTTPDVVTSYASTTDSVTAVYAPAASGFSTAQDLVFTAIGFGPYASGNTDTITPPSTPTVVQSIADNQSTSSTLGLWVGSSTPGQSSIMQQNGTLATGSGFDGFTIALAPPSSAGQTNTCGAGSAVTFGPAPTGTTNSNNVSVGLAGHTS